MPEQTLEIADRGPRIVVTEPPEPIGALAYGQLTLQLLQPLVGVVVFVQGLIVIPLRLSQQIPGPILVLSPIQVVNVP